MRWEYVATMQPNYYQPKLGTLAIVLLALLLANTFLLVCHYGRAFSEETTPSATNWMYVMVGVTYGWASAISWLLSAVKRRYVRWSGQLAVTLFFAAGLQELSSDVYARYFSTLGGLIFIQTVMFHLLRIPRWQKSSRTVESRPFEHQFGKRAQFGIGEIIAATACLAALFSIAIQYRTEETDTVYYWATLTTFWLIAPLSSASMTIAVLGKRPWPLTIAWMFLSISLTGFAAGGLSIAQVWLLQREQDLVGTPYWPIAQILFVAYSIVLLTTLLIFALVAWFGRWQALYDANRTQAESATSDQDSEESSE
ncbi:MAG: hypothetical protein AAGI63_16675 [Planctomycetota bacterium]